MSKKLPPLPTQEEIKDELIEEKNSKGRKIAEFVKAQPPTSRGGYMIRACIHFAALGYSQKDIARHLGISAGRVSAIMKSQSCQSEIERLQKEFFDPDKIFKQILPEAVKVTRRIMNRASAKDSDKLTAASQFMDRALGKAKQTMEVQGSAIKDLFAALDKSRNTPHYLTPPIEAEFNEVSDKKESPKENQDSMDEWLDQHLK